jgi:hypothetical protein
MDNPYAKQRRFPRIPAEYPVLVRKLEGEKITRLSCTKVVGLGGCMFQHDHPFGAASLLSLLILVKDRYIETRARVAYERPQRDQKYEIGVEFLEIADDDLEALKDLFKKDDEPSE